MLRAKEIVLELKRLGNEDIASHSQYFFKTGKGEYGEGDIFLGIRVPVLRQQVKLFVTAPLNEVEKLLHSKFHEARLLAVLILVAQFKCGNNQQKANIYKLYLSNTDFINNWDIVDSSAHLIIGPYLQERSHKILYKLAKSKKLWERRIAVMSTFHFIKQNDFTTALEIIELLLEDKEDLIHKVTGWMLREIGKREQEAEEIFLKEHYQLMPRTMLRYAIEKFPERRRQQYLKGRI